MSSKKILSVGQCVPDHTTICNFLSQHFDVEVDRTHLPDDTLEAVRNKSYDLVLVNRKLDEDYSDGIEIIRAIKAEEGIADTPVMLITNYPDHQQQAVRAGALPGFGKLEFDKPETHKRLATLLG